MSGSGAGFDGAAFGGGAGRAKELTWAASAGPAGDLMNKKRKPQKRGEFVPIGDIAFDLPGVSVKALSDRAPQARYHFTTLH